MSSTDTAWEAFGKLEPYYGVFSKPYFLTKNLSGEVRDVFFATGEKHVDDVLGIVRESLDPNFAPRRCLDFGCGVGRVAIPLARRAKEVVGVDVSESMLAEARQNCETRGVANLKLLRSDDELSALAGTFDFIHSFVVFQHIPRKRGEAIFDSLLQRLSDGGVGVLHFTFATRASLVRRGAQWVRGNVPLVHNLMNVLQRRPFGFPHMQMNCYDVDVLMGKLHERGCHRVHVRFTDHGQHLGVVLFFKKAPAPEL